MPRAFNMTPTAPLPTPITARLGAGNAIANNLSDSDLKKVVRLVGESRYDLCAAGDEIEGCITSVEQALQGGFTIGGVQNEGRMYVRCDGLQGTPGTGVLAVGDYVVAGTVTAKGTALTDYPKVCKATAQTGASSPIFKWRVVSLLTGAGAVGTTAVIELIY